MFHSLLLLVEGVLMPHTPKEISTEGYSGSDRRIGGDPTEGLPWWVRFITIVGIPGAIAIFLVYVGATEIPKIKVEAALAKDAALQNQRLLLQHQEQSEAMFRMLQRICSNTAKDYYDRQRCFDK